MHKFTYQHLGFFADLRLAVPALAAELDFARAEQLPTSRIAAAGGRGAAGAVVDGGQARACAR